MRRTVQVMLVVAIVIDVAYWTTWALARDVLASSHREAYYEFENAFPLADLWLAVACAGALVAVTRGSVRAPLWLTAAGAAGLYLFGMDFLYDVEHGIFLSGGGGVVEAVIVALTLVFSLTMLVHGWREDGRARERDSQASLADA
ncbi:hypothetical protein [Nocardioides sp. GY 10127]|uniref:hypothetical protein n=1 Tax=Nocardioides sp. GY 10127 TaxID=2569762 RepID=UPI0010A7E884|nr:hypothetical protein [Nocardioides sp. GY 10127]TIC81716.1 hypothetical protein E8D37_11020 [Nocardioides sp. GY 10127]